MARKYPYINLDARVLVDHEDDTVTVEVDTFQLARALDHDLSVPYDEDEIKEDRELIEGLLMSTPGFMRSEIVLSEEEIG